ncbi:MAG: preprotein translocase subunit YajC [Planctomycetota bacterium]
MTDPAFRTPLVAHAVPAATRVAPGFFALALPSAAWAQSNDPVADPGGGGADPSADPGTASTTEGGAPQTTPPPQGIGSEFLLIMGLVIGAMFLFTILGGRKEKKRRASMLSSLRKGQRVQTAGGVLGSVVEVRDHEVVLKVDENNNTKIPFARSAIQSVLSDSASPALDKSDKPDKADA